MSQDPVTLAARYVASPLDEGPGIEQDIERISHQATPRVISNGDKTVVFGG